MCVLLLAARSNNRATYHNLYEVIHLRSAAQAKGKKQSRAVPPSSKLTKDRISINQVTYWKMKRLKQKTTEIPQEAAAKWFINLLIPISFQDNEGLWFIYHQYTVLHCTVVYVENEIAIIFSFLSNSDLA